MFFIVIIYIFLKILKIKKFENKIFDIFYKIINFKYVIFLNTYLYSLNKFLLFWIELRPEINNFNNASFKLLY